MSEENFLKMSRKIVDQFSSKMIKQDQQSAMSQLGIRSVQL